LQFDQNSSDAGANQLDKGDEKVVVESGKKQVASRVAVFFGDEKEENKIGKFFGKGL
jgi:hypothetical protein